MDESTDSLFGRGHSYSTLRRKIRKDVAQATRFSYLSDITSEDQSQVDNAKCRTSIPIHGQMINCHGLTFLVMRKFFQIALMIIYKIIWSSSCHLGQLILAYHIQRYLHFFVV